MACVLAGAALGESARGQTTLADSVADWRRAGSDPFSSVDAPPQGHPDSVGCGSWRYGTYATVSNPATFTDLAYFAAPPYPVGFLGQPHPSGAYLFGASGAASDYPLLTDSGGHPIDASFRGSSTSLQAVRRWVSGFAGEVTIAGTLRDPDANQTDGVIGRIYVGGTLAWEAPLVVNLQTIPFSFVQTVAVGTTVDFVIDENVNPHDDSTLFTSTISTAAEVVPCGYVMIGPRFNPATGSYYAFVAATTIPWCAARTGAESFALSDGPSGVPSPGYLATVTTLSENAFLESTFRAPNSALALEGWLGATDQDVEGEWRWVTGPEGAADGGLGLLFWLGDAGGSAVGGLYSKWVAPEPSNDASFSNDELGLRAGEHFLAISQATFFPNDPWNDLPNDPNSAANRGLPYGGARIQGYYVEFATGGPLAAPTIHWTPASLCCDCEEENTPPVAICALESVAVEATSSYGALIAVLDGSASTDPDGDALTFHWDVSDLTVVLDDADSAAPVGWFPVGVTTATLTVSDGRGGFDTCDVVVTVQDTTPPQVICTSDTALLWPPNHKIHTVRILITGSDIVSDPSELVVVSLTLRSDEPDDSYGDGKTRGDVHGADGFTHPVDVTSLLHFEPSAGANGAWVVDVKLRAERDGGGDGRCYTVEAVAIDQGGNVGQSSCCVVVPHDRRRG